MIELYSSPHFWSMYWAAAFIHALVFIKLHGGVSSKVEAFWTTVGLTIVFPIVAVVTLWELAASVLFFMLKPSTSKAKKEAEREALDLIERIKST